jgi:hypothetical protein
MDQPYPGLACPVCSKLLYASSNPTDRLWECERCERRIFMDSRAHTALELATRGGTRVEVIIWKEIVPSNILAVFFFFAFALLWALRIVNWLALGISVILVIALGGLILDVIKNREDVTQLKFMPIIGLVAFVPWGLFFLIPHIEPTIKRKLPNQFVSAVFVLVSGRGLVLTEGVEPMLLPVSSIVGWTYVVDNAVLMIDYVTANDKVATITLHGTEYGGVYDILVAKFGERARVI